VVYGIAAVKLVVHLYAGRHYGYFVDELYYLACSEHLDWGYVDQPPLIVSITAVARWLFGDSLQAIRLLPALAGAGKVVLTALIARELGGGRFAQGLAALAILVAPGFLATDDLLSMNAFEPLFWTGCALMLVRIIRTGDMKLWVWFGLLAGVGLENKHSMLLFGCGLIAGLELTPERRLLRTRWFWLGGVLAFVIFLPNLLWNIDHHFPFLELQENIRRSGRNVHLTPVTFFGQEILTMFPLSAPIWLAGLWYYLFRRDGKPFCALGWAWLITAGLILILNPRVYYLYPAFPILFAAGGVIWESWLANPRWQWVKPAYGAVMVLFGVLLAPMAIPVLPADTYIRYAKALHLSPPRIETFQLGLAAALCRPVWLGGNGGHGWPYLQRPAAGGPGQDRDFRPELRPSRRDRPIRAEVRLAQGHQRASKLFPLGAARLFRRKRHRDGRPAGKARKEFRLCGEGWDGRPPVRHAVRTLRRVLLPGAEMAAQRNLADGEELEVDL
jgi:4-amino-4-deoxy-L-arabinose transferase-like glycosyltransferase